MPRCDHEEADTRIVVHLKDALDKGCTNCLFHGLRHNFRFLRQREEISMEAWNAYVEVTEAFNNFMNHPYMTVTVNCKQFQLLERFTVIIYNKTSNLDSVNEARRELFSQKNRPMEKIPQRKKPFCSTHCAQSTKLESGQPVINVINMATRAASNLWMIDKAPIDEFTGARLPSKEQVLLRYYHHHR
ncbi:hypothetical protein GWK47_014556 [Chionoecetes opilio]|uniref:Uncharacterized protein n=1 Tax=Chionoecetes opilio TaxID=41210 RepID=A0A8J4XT78_CHIOP|nr:hypothetical protein GWK47_014556 [Chionoecetes opilio]